MAAFIPLAIAAKDIYEWHQGTREITSWWNGWTRTVGCLVIALAVGYTIPHRYLPLSPDDFDKWPPKK